MPTSGDFGLVGVDGGLPFAANPCLAQQVVWARTFGRPAYYANTANPGPRLSSHWPIGQQSPRVCARAKPDSDGCAFDYGVERREGLLRPGPGRRSFGRRQGSLREHVVAGRRAAQHLGGRRVRSSAPSFLRNDIAALAGMMHALHRKGVRHVGVYSTAHQWGVVTGGASLGRAPVWYAGTGTQANARTHCRPAFSFTGGPIRLAQYATNGFDGDLRCCMTDRIDPRSDLAAWQATLPRKRMGAGVLVRDSDDRVLLVEPTYKPDWEIPGGTIELDESPRTGCAREVREELGLDLAVGRLLVFEWQPSAHDRTESLLFVYDGGVLPSDAEITLPADGWPRTAWSRSRTVTPWSARAWLAGSAPR